MSELPPSQHPSERYSGQDTAGLAEGLCSSEGPALSLPWGRPGLAWGGGHARPGDLLFWVQGSAV